MRDDFNEHVKRAVAARAGNRCSNPDCRALTSGPQVDITKSLNVGVAAHITAASPGGPRYNASLTPKDRRHADNAIWLCQNCAKLVDIDTARFPETTLREWKQNAETEALASVGRTRTALSEEPSDATKGLSLMDERFKLVIEDYKKRGTPKYMIDTFLDLSRQEKAELYDRAIMWKKGRKSQNNPYVMSSSS